jgi:glycerol-3-phosphate cytidylyltransferase
MIRGFTCSAFDLLHPGHLRMLEECKKYCDYLIVGLQTDPSIDRPNKAKPIQTTLERFLQLKACKYVDEIIVYDTERDLRNLLSVIDINIRFLGEEYLDTNIVGEDVCAARNIDLWFNDKRLHDYSSSLARQQILQPLYDNPYDSYLFYLGFFAKSAKPGLYLEFGVYKGRSLHVIAKNSNGNKVYGFDSFNGLPEDWQGDFMKGSLKCDIPTNIPKNSELVIGYFEDTLEQFLKEHPDPITFIHVDCDIYSGTKYLLEKCHPQIADGCYICFDDYLNYPDYEKFEYKAFNEYLDKYGVKVTPVGAYGPHQSAFIISKE